MIDAVVPKINSILCCLTNSVLMPPCGSIEVNLNGCSWDNTGLAGIGVIGDTHGLFFMAFPSFIGVWTWLGSFKQCFKATKFLNASCPPC